MYKKQVVHFTFFAAAFCLDAADGMPYKCYMRVQYAARNYAEY